MAYIKKILTYDALQYTGDTQAVTNFGANWFNTGNDQIQIGVNCHDGIHICGMNDYILKDSAGSYWVVNNADFNGYYQLVV